MFALHFVAFWLLLFSVLAPLGALSVGLALKLSGLSENLLDPIASWLLMALSAVWVYRAFGRIYGGGLARRVLGAAFVAFLIPVIRVLSVRGIPDHAVHHHMTGAS